MQKKPCKIYSNPKNKNREKFTMNLMLMNKFSEAQAKKNLAKFTVNPKHKTRKNLQWTPSKKNLQWTVNIKTPKSANFPWFECVYKHKVSN